MFITRSVFRRQPEQQGGAEVAGKTGQGNAQRQGEDFVDAIEGQAGNQAGTQRQLQNREAKNVPDTCRPVFRFATVVFYGQQ